MIRTMVQSLVLCTLVLILSAPLSAQDLTPGFKHWYSAGITARFSKKTSLRYSRLHAFDTKPNRLQFVQNTLEFSRNLEGPWKVYGGYKHGAFFRNEETRNYHRVYGAIRHKAHLGSHFSMANKVTAEFHFPQLPKYRIRFLYENKISMRTKNWPLNASPYIKNQIQYYLDGKPISYYEEGELLVRQAPNDFHRYRLTAGVRLKPFKGLSMSVYYLMQREFNTSLTEYRGLNVPNASGTSLRRRFNHYSLVGVSLNYTFKTYRTKLKKHRK